ncbi:protein kinase domain-containing protein, partial [uncultured Veillonella sp.]|uniref:protein kinase domain-containing protein n=1 Tax=uncultured Veillonella sp. TaxID=159268 RepID=UPI002632DB9A
MKEMQTKLQGLVLDNRYEIISKIGVGGMADVFKGKDTLLGRIVAIKILHANFAGDEEFVAKFKREAQAAGKLNHPNIVSMYDVGFDQGYNYIVMEYVEGQTLKEYIVNHKQISVDQAVKFTIAIAEGLEHAHAMGIVHCDIKPHNVLITTSGRIKVTDFGIARAMNAGNTIMYTNSIMGSAHYLSPEQASGKPVNGSTDIYSLGAVLYEMLTGRVPYDGDTPI